VIDSFELYGLSNSYRMYMILTYFGLRITPLPVKCGDLLFLSTTPECYRSYVSIETVVLSMLFNKDLKVPDSKSATQIKNREKAKAANPFTLRAIVAKEKKAAEKIEPRWAPVIETVPVSVVVDELQKPVDVRRLVPSRGTGPPKLRHRPALASREPKARKVFSFIVD
jgi:hypothetical protein